ncbi:RusA family crossover junction endodeoxyribonuclease [Streptosporangium saharense]|uniref:RusA family crossover junction endodeoxyribonuclease n=1 Tax=Streptosporangium saharense TaxID=1706840 RepID=UPI0036A61263
MVTRPWLEIVALGQPAPQGSKRHVGGGVMVEMSKRLKPWRKAVAEYAAVAMAARSTLLDGQIIAEMVFTVRSKPTGRPTWWPAGLPWSRHTWWLPASAPDLSKLIRATEDALTGVVWRDDARVVAYRRAAKVYVGQPGEPDALPEPGAVIRVWAIPAAAEEIHP